jgi:ATP-dependent Clp protease ATP-binding subunit ClpC
LYQHLSKTAKEVLTLSKQLAKDEMNEYVGSEHVLMAILDHGLGVGAQVLHNCSVSLEAVKDQVAAVNKVKMEQTWVMGQLPGTPHFKEVLSFAIEEAEKAKDKKVGTEYLLLGILREKQCIAEQVLRAMGLTLAKTREEIARLQGRPGWPGSDKV